MSRIFGIIVGVMLADIFSSFVGIHDWSLAFLIGISLGISSLLKLGKDAVTQVGVSALLVMTAGAGNLNYGIDRIIETIIGAVISKMEYLLKRLRNCLEFLRNCMKN